MKFITLKQCRNKTPSLDGFPGKFHQIFKGERTQVCTFSEAEGEGITSHPYYEAVITLIRKPDKDTPRKLQNMPH